MREIEEVRKMRHDFSIYKQYKKNVDFPKVIKEEHQIPVTYLCWGCGSSISRYEAIDLPISVKELWNLCPRCVAFIKRENRAKNQRI
jgi:hypothetical protein